jgi:hypothetical protein
MNNESAEERIHRIISDEFEYYLAHQDEFVAKYDGKTIVLKNHEVVGVYDSIVEAYRGALENHSAGTFILQKVSEGTQDTHSSIYGSAYLA